MTTVFLTRRQYEVLCDRWKINGPERNAYLCAKDRKWSITGVKFSTDVQTLLQMVKEVGGKVYEK